jgi:hypothetical protein
MVLAFKSGMWEFSCPPHKGDDHFDLGIWHPSALPAHMQNKDGYHALQRRVEEVDWNSELEGSQESDAEKAVQQFSDEVIKLVDGLPVDDNATRQWTIALRCNPLFLLISLWPEVGIELAPVIAELAKRHGLVCYDPQSDVVTLPRN